MAWQLKDKALKLSSKILARLGSNSVELLVGRPSTKISKNDWVEKWQNLVSFQYLTNQIDQILLNFIKYIFIIPTFSLLKRVFQFVSKSVCRLSARTSMQSLVIVSHSKLLAVANFITA